VSVEEFLDLALHAVVLADHEVTAGLEDEELRCGQPPAE
jgi:hypothetical protein